MEVILREHVDNLGRRGEVVKVADGYARNYLLPRKLALVVTEGNKKQIERERAKFDAVEAEEKKVVERTRTKRQSESERRRVKRGLPPTRQPGEGRSMETEDADDDRFDGVEV